jgi:glycosyltransferase involved in cell wall biosynthesis
MSSLSLCLIAKNEAHQLARCIESVRGLAEDVLVLDTGSTDGTPELARSLGARVEFFEWCNDFAAARNVALTHIASDWVLVLDADEWLLPGAIASIQKAIADPQTLVINLLRQEIGADQSPYSLVSRLFRRHPAIQFDRPYHAIIDDAVEALLAREPNWQIRALDEVAVAHDGYRADRIAALSKVDRARKAMEAFWEENPEDPYVCSKLGALYVSQGEGDRGLDLLKQGLRQAERDNHTELRYELHYHIGVAYARQQNWTLAQAHYRGAIAQPVLPMIKLGALVNLGHAYHCDGQLSDARAQYEAALAIDPDLAIAHAHLGTTLKASGDLRGALAHHRRAVDLAPTRPDFWQNFGAILLRGGNVPASLDAFGQAIALYQERQDPEAERLTRELAAMGFTPRLPTVATPRRS